MKTRLRIRKLAGSLGCIVVFLHGLQTAHAVSVEAATKPAAGSILAGPITNPANGHGYYLLSPTDWNAAEALAVTLGGHLATINDAEENAWVLATFGSYDETLWIGLNDRAVENAFGWVNGETTGYRNWETGEPNNGGGYFPNEDAAVIVGPTYAHPGTWYDGPEEQINAAVVELSVAPSPAATGKPAGICPSLIFQPDGSIRVRFTGNVGITYTVEASSNLVDWKTVGTYTPDANGNCEFVEMGSAGLPCRFYRIVSH